MNLEDFEKKLRPVDELELLPAEIDRIIVDPQNGAIVVLHADGKEVGYPLNSAEGADLVFIRSQCVTEGHLPMLPEMLLRTWEDIGSPLSQVVLESKVGDIFYCRLIREAANHRRTYSVCSIGDALVLASLTKCPVKIVRKVLEDMEDLDWPAEQEFDLE